MHDAVADFVAQWASAGPVRVLDIGGRRVSTERYYRGPQVRELFPDAQVYHVLDIAAAPDVDIVADATRPAEEAGIMLGWYNVVVCTEVLEHVKEWRRLLQFAHDALAVGGRLIVTCAGPGRQSHPAGSEDMVLPVGEFYANVSHLSVRKVLGFIGYRSILTWQIGNDTQATAVK